MGRPEQDDGAGVETPDDAVRAGFVALQALSKQWMEKEREGISLIESFQTALLATRAATAATTTTTTTRSTRKESAMASFTGTENDFDANMDPWLAEDLFAQIKELLGGFTELLGQMYTIHCSVNRASAEDDREDDGNGLVLAMADYAQFIACEVATFEAEFQHIESLLGMISFAITTDQLRTLVISWSTSPFLDLEASRAFRQRHDQSQELRH